MAQAILLPLIEDGRFLPEEVIGVVGKKQTIKNVLKQIPDGIKVVSAADPTAQEAWSAPVQLLAVKPQQLFNVEADAKAFKFPKLKSKRLLISILAGVKLHRLAKTFPQHICIRSVPNTPVLVRSGLTGLSYGQEMPEDQRQVVENIFKPISEVFELPESLLDAFLALTSSGPAYVALMMEGLADGAVAAGLPRILASELTNKTLLGTALLQKKKNFHPGQLKDMIASPGGTTITALRHLEMAGFRSALIEAVVAAAQRSRELG